MQDSRDLLNRFLGQSPDPSAVTPDISDIMSRFAGNLPGGLAGGAMAGGIMALLVSNKSARKFLGKAAGYGGAAVLGGLAYRALTNWKQGNQSGSSVEMSEADRFVARLDQIPGHHLTLIKAMTAAAMADGHIDAGEQQRIFEAVERMQFSVAEKGMIFDLMRQPVTIEELAASVAGLEQKTEIYLAACLAMNPDQPEEDSWLHRLAIALELPAGLAAEIQSETRRAAS